MGKAKVERTAALKILSLRTTVQARSLEIIHQVHFEQLIKAGVIVREVEKTESVSMVDRFKELQASCKNLIEVIKVALGLSNGKGTVRLHTNVRRRQTIGKI